MKKLAVKLENSYGIRKLDYTFDFEKTKVYSIYATNGSMKTSFTKTFNDLSNDVASSDLIFPERTTVRDVKEDATDVSPDKVFVVEPYNPDYQSDKTSTLLVNQELKKQYDAIWTEIKNLEADLIKSLVKPSGRKDVDDEVSEVFISAKGKFLDAVQRVSSEVNDGKAPIYNGVSYKILFDEKVLKVLADIQPELADYINRYNELVDQSKYFKRGVFNHTNATVITDALVKNGFFDASHAVTLSDGTAKSEITSKDELKKVIETELQDILKDEKLRKAFDKIDKKLTGNQQVKDFREYITEHQELISELANVNHFKQKIWIDYFKASITEYNNLVNAHNDAKTELDTIRGQANAERTRWSNVVELFNERFNVPFTLSVENQGDVILDDVLPSLSFTFNDGDSKPVKRDDLLKVLSTGEKKALYILNLLFEVEARVDQKQETLMIVDDIADSFDYKNKYAIIEYLKDISEKDGFYQIILTHNFDFFRTIQSRYPVSRNYCLMVNRATDGVELVKAEYVENPFKYFIENTKDDAKLLALVPFVRNIVEYNDVTADFDKLTSTLHIKDDTDTVAVKDVQDIVKKTFGKEIEVSDASKKVADLFIEVADALGSTDSLGLENKIVLSVAIRLTAEKFMIKEINDATFVQALEGNQTRGLANKYIEDNSTKEKEVSVIKKVCLITPQNIHINSFMYEPILDMSDIELKELYVAVKAL